MPTPRIKQIDANLLVDAAVAAGGGVPIRASGTELAIGGAPQSGVPLAIFESGNQRIQLRGNNSVGRIILYNAGSARADWLENASTILFRSSASIPLIFGTNNVERMRLAAAAAELGIGGAPVSGVACAALMGTGVGLARLGGLAHVDTTETSTTAVVTEETLTTYSLPANSLAQDGTSVRIRAWGRTASNVNGKTARLYFGALTVVALGLSTSGAHWVLDAIVTRVGASSQDAGATAFSGSLQTNTHTALTETLSGAVVIKCTGQNVVASAGDITIHGLCVEHLSY